MKFNFSDLVGKQTGIDLLEVQSFEMNVYLVKVRIGNDEGLVYGKEDRPMRFHSTQHIRDAFENNPVKEAIMTHDSPYDEMIGNPPKANDNISVPFSMTQPY
ncbi:DUF6482 family protein [Aestuariibacter salexigens]|uniref:DUF6482 family protein n=1 Tax=Aestuariibacter salexigens TaxID=226010 RepID=UPI0003FCF25A|nr:DUF6482 family protein [Aestuariibacter salexigens]